MDLPRVPISGAASSVSDILFQKACFSLEKVPQARRVSAVIVDGSCLSELNSAYLKETALESETGTCEMSMELMVPRVC